MRRSRFGEPATSARFVCNGALRFHAAPGTYVANIHKTLSSRRAFFCFHRLITAGTPNNRRLIHAILHNPSPTGESLLFGPQQISYLRFYRGALACRTMRARCAAISNLGKRSSHAKESALPPTQTRVLRISSSNCGAVATLSRFLHSATLPGGLLGRIPTHSNELGAWHDS